MPHAIALKQRASQRALGLLLALVIAGAWVGLHIYAVLVFELSWANLPLALVMAALLCWLSVGVFIVSHDAMHGSLAPGWPRVNATIGGSLLFLYAGFAWRRMRDAHFAHHRHAGHAADPDFCASHPSEFGHWYGAFFTRYFGWQSVLFVSSVVAIYWLWLDVPMEQLVLLYGLPAIASSVQLFYFGTFRPHRHDGTRFADSHNARSDTFGTAKSLLTCFHFGYHHEHHLAPQVPWWALPRYRQRQANKVIADGEPSI